VAIILCPVIVEGMYELVKKKSIFTRILIGVVILFLTTSTLKYILKESNIDKQLMEVASEINKSSPIVVDSLTTLDNTVALPGNTFQYNYSIKADRKNVDTSALASIIKKSVINMIRTDPKEAFFKNNKTDIQAKFTDRNGVYITTVKISHSDYQ
jgi:hypothetical protein